MSMKHPQTVAITALAITLTLTGCVTTSTLTGKDTTMTERPAIAAPEGISTDTPDELLTWTLRQIDGVVRTLGPNYSWEHNGNPPLPWDPDDREGFVPDVCGGEDPDIKQYNIQIEGTDATPNPDELAKKVRAYWEAQGYEVGQLGPAEHDETGLLELTVFLNNKAGLSYSVGTEGHSIQVTSECAKV